MIRNRIQKSSDQIYKAIYSNYTSNTNIEIKSIRSYLNKDHARRRQQDATEFLMKFVEKFVNVDRFIHRQIKVVRHCQYTTTDNNELDIILHLLIPEDRTKTYDLYIL